ncbi:MAG: Exodeoxyribonuclease 7 large subunit [Methanoregula sp. SKADARSKE-2]|nr:MAG: Exodeoxyribonuclease 7 large subunit [Methanoregula sp. SKADARSKE-2]
MDWFNQPEPLAGGMAPPLRVSELSAIIEDLLDDSRLQDIYVKGEVTNYTHHARGHRYFSLSEKGSGHNAAVIRCVLWKSDAERLSFSPTEGMEVTVTGTVRLYAPHGSYQLQIRTMQKAGRGEKCLLVEQWRKDLAAEGLFATERKRPLPRFPQRIGVVTSETGAVIHDIATVVERRYPVEILISPTAVQGEDAHRQIARAIRRLFSRVDLLIVARGGGSFEDLFPFNNPEVVRAIAESPVPVVSAIGHEVDVTLSDLAADIRAPTPSAAAELAVPDQNVLLLRLDEMRIQLGCSLEARLGRGRKEVADLQNRLRPKRVARRLDEKKQVGADLSDRLTRAWENRVGRERLLLAEMKTALEGRSPLAVLARGYCVAEKDGRVVRGAGELLQNDRMRIRFYDGNSQVIVEKVDRES